MTSDAPSSITVTEAGATDFTIVRRWRGTRTLFGLDQAVFVCLFAVVVSVLVSFAVVSAGKLGEGWPIFIAMAFMLYVSVLNVVDRTTISVRNHELSIEHGPLPWLRSRRVPIDQIAQIGTVFRRLRVVLRDGTDVTLLAYPVWAALGAEEASFIAAELGRRIVISAVA